MKENYVSYVIQEYLSDGNFDAAFGDAWIDETRLAALAAEACDYAFAPYGIDAMGNYASSVEVTLDGMIKNNVILREGDDYSGFWYHLRPPEKRKHLEELKRKNPAAVRISAIGEEALRRALNKIVEEDGLRSMEEKWAAAEKEDGSIATAEDDLPRSPNPSFFQAEQRKEQFVSLADVTLNDVEASNLSNVQKSQARGFLTAARALSETPEPPTDLIWMILNRANSVAGIGSFFLALIMLIGMVI